MAQSQTNRQPFEVTIEKLIYGGDGLARVNGRVVLAPFVLPTDLLTLFGVCVTGYVFARTADKTAALPGDSKVSILGMTVGNKS